MIFKLKLTPLRPSALKKSATAYGTKTNLLLINYQGNMTKTATKRTPITLIADETQKLLDWADSVQQSNDTIFHKAKTLATRLGAHNRADGLTEIGFWAPELAADMFQPKNIYLEVLTPLNKIDPTLPNQKIKFHREHLQL
ncbi:MAG: glucosylglycerol hydrolase, partial [Coleofasciculus sp. C2-GNP5-27]